MAHPANRLIISLKQLVEMDSNVHHLPPINPQTFMKLCLPSALLFLLPCQPSQSADWPQGSGRHGSFQTDNEAPTEWSVVREQNLRWKVILPETGQNTPVIAEGKVFFSTLKPVDADASLGKDILAWCYDADSGVVLWSKEITGKHPLRLSGCFSDSSSPPAVCDGEHVVFVNASGGIAGFDLEGELIWSRDTLSVGRTLPFLCDGKFIFTRQVYPPEPDGNFPHKYADSPREMWTQLQALDIKTGEEIWTTECGVNMGCAVLPETLPDGRAVAMVGRGGGHGPPEKPAGVSVVDLADGSTLWTLPLEGFMATMSYRIHEDAFHLFHGGEHLSVEATTGKILRRTSIVDQVEFRSMAEISIPPAKGRTITIPKSKKNRMITQTSNLLVGPWHYFRCYTKPWLGRVDVRSGKVEYLELPIQLKRTAETDQDELLSYRAPKKKGDPKLEQQGFAPNSMKNSRGHVVFGDKRSKGSGWGHVASSIPSVAGEHLYVPVMNGTVYVLRWNADVLDKDAVVAINDLGPVGESYHRASLSFSQGRVYAHTIRELICIGPRIKK